MIPTGCSPVPIPHRPPPIRCRRSAISWSMVRHRAPRTAKPVPISRSTSALRWRTAPLSGLLRPRRRPSRPAPSMTCRSRITSRCPRARWITPSAASWSTRMRIRPTPITSSLRVSGFTGTISPAFPTMRRRAATRSPEFRSPATASSPMWSLIRRSRFRTVPSTPARPLPSTSTIPTVFPRARRWTRIPCSAR